MSTAVDGSSRAIKDLRDLRVGVIGKLDLVISGFSTIEGDLDSVTHVLPGHTGFSISHGRGTAVES